MKLETAINLNEDTAEDEFKSLTDNERKAVKLGIEALKRVKYDRLNYRIPYNSEELLGETEE